MCDPSFNLTNCDKGSSSSSTLDIETTDNSQSDNTETPLMIPDISPTNKDLKDAKTEGDLGSTVTDATDDVSDDDNDDDDHDDDDNSGNPDNDRDSSNSEDGSSDSETSLIQFP
ncbi:MAG: hypothetical protein GEU26_16040 [Nitrososphaeraceae archaeon]|nr:hypothetical protein [Nitrososphaeraceae archaeon]